MPSIDDLNRKKRFKKTAYRPWNLMDEPSSDFSPTPSDAAKPQTDSEDTSKMVPQPGIADHSDATGGTAVGIASISPANNQQTASISPANNQQTASISPANNQQTTSRKANLGKRKNDIASISPAISPADTPANHQQTTSKSPAIWNVAALSGKEALLLNVIYQHCKNIGSLATENIGSEQLAESLKVSTKRLNNLVERLLDKKLVEIIAFKPGRGSWRKFQLNDATYREAAIWDIASKSPANNQHIASISPSISPAISPAEPSSSSSSLNSYREELLTTGEIEPTGQKELGALWQKVDPSPLAECRFGHSHIAQIAHSGRVSPEQLQDSIYAFAYDLSENQKAKSISGAPLNYFMGILRKGPYVPPANYESPEERQQRLYLEAKEQQYRRRQEREARLETVEFEEWVEKLSVNERAEIVPPNNFAKPGGTAHTVQLREYFRENIWPALKERSKGVTP